MTETAPDLRLLVTFAAVADHASFSKAAAKLGVAKGTVSRSIAELERRLGVELLHRTTHHVALSTAGAALHERVRAHLAGLRAAIVDLPERDEEPSGLLRMTASNDVATVVLPPVLAAFTRRHPAVRFDVHATGTKVDLVKEGFDLALRGQPGRIEDSRLTARRVGRTSGAFYAAPSYLARRGRPRRLGDDRHTWVLHPVALRLWRTPAERVQFLVDDFLLARELMREGVGVGFLPVFVARAHVREGLLDEIALPDVALPAGDLVALYPSGARTPRKVTAFRDFLVEVLRSGLGPA